MQLTSSASSSRTTTATSPTAGACRRGARASSSAAPATRSASPGSAAAEVGAPAEVAGGQHPATGRACAAPFTVQHNDQIGELKLRAGQYRITLLAVGRLSCNRASNIFARFLQDYTGDLPGNWRLDPETATFSKSSHYGFRVKAV